MKTSSAKQKGRRLCQTVKLLILQCFQSLKEDDVLVTSSGATGEDLKFSPFARSLFPYAVECKNQEKLNIWKSFEQAQSHAAGRDGISPILFISKNRSDVLVVMTATEFFKIKKTKGIET